MRLFYLLVLSSSVFAQSTNPNQVRDRGQTRPQDESQSWTRGRLGTQQPIPYKLQDFSGTLVDASCDDRSALNLQQQPEQEPAQPAVPKGSAKNAPQKLNADAIAHQTPDVVTRQPDRSCAVSGATRGFALLTRDGRLLNLDEGGNTMAIQGIQSTAAGRAMLNGTGGALKPQVTLRGRVQGDRLIVEKILKI
jgi:hypothetical protein